MAKFNIGMLEDKALEDFLHTFPDRLQKKVLTKVLKQVGVTLTTILKQPPPAGIKVNTGDPRDSHIGWWRNTVVNRPMKRKRNRVGINVSPGTRSDLGAFQAHKVLKRSGDHVAVFRAYTQATKGKYFYPAHAEFGHKIAKTNKRVQPYPYMKNALIRNRQGLLNLVHNRLSTELDLEFTRREALAGLIGMLRYPGTP